ncbi:MAG: MmcQ/YjbR family DNA-binding protein [Thermotogaceae bacterium]|nr:MmcQ/YjbR family DNA-binding protein [Thermotogaceae bacterium]
MKYAWLDEYCLSKLGTTKDFKEEWEATRYMLRGKMYAMVGENKEKQPIITLKLEPTRGMALRETYADIAPGYYMNKVHWNSINLRGNVPDAVLKNMIDESYRLLLASFSQKAQKEITGG